MATITFAYETKCAHPDPHVRLAIKINGTKRSDITFKLGELYDSPPLTDEQIEPVALAVLRGWARQWRLANPGANLAQMRAALEAQVWTV